MDINQDTEEYNRAVFWSYRKTLKIYFIRWQCNAVQIVKSRKEQAIEVERTKLIRVAIQNLANRAEKKVQNERIRSKNALKKVEKCSDTIGQSSSSTVTSTLVQNSISKQFENCEQQRLERLNEKKSRQEAAQARRDWLRGTSERLRLAREAEQAEKIKENERLLKRQAEEEIQRKEHELLKQKENRNMAKNHYRKFLIRRYGWIPWLQLLYLKKKNYHTSQSCYNTNLQRKTWNAWKQHYCRVKALSVWHYQEQMRAAEQAEKLKIVGKIWYEWKNLLRHRLAIESTVSARRALFSRQQIWNAWKCLTKVSVDKAKRNFEIAIDLNCRMKRKHAILFWRCFVQWTKIARIRKIEEADAWNKVQIWLGEAVNLP